MAALVRDPQNTKPARLAFLLPNPSSRRQRNTRLEAIPCLRATADTDDPAISATTAAFSASVHLRRVSATTAKLFSGIYPDIGTVPYLSSRDFRHQRHSSITISARPTRRVRPNAYKPAAISGQRGEGQRRSQQKIQGTFLSTERTEQREGPGKQKTAEQFCWAVFCRIS
jgi:hypothetical protein